MTESDGFHVFDRSAENVTSISSYIQTVGLFSNRPLSKGLLEPGETMVFLLVSTRCSSVDCVGIPLRISSNFCKFLVPSIGCLYILGL